jgi:hypothetical protein
MPVDTTEIEESIDNLDLRIRRLKIEYDRFFNGALDRPPEQFRQSINGDIQALRTVHIKDFSLRFRLTNLEARFNTYCVLFHRRIQEMEEGTLLERRSTSLPREVFDPRGGIVIDETPARGAVQALFDEVYANDKERSDANFTRFHTYLLQQVTNIRQKTGCTGVKFRVESKDGKPKLKAKPV